MYNTCQLVLMSNKTLMDMISISIDELGLADEVQGRKIRVKSSNEPTKKKRIIKYD